MTEQEKDEILATLTRGQAVLREAVQGVTLEGSMRSPRPGKWSILQCMEHVAITEGYLLAQLEAAKRADVPMINADREAGIKAHGASRIRRFETPEVCKPKGDFDSLPEAFEHFLACRERTVEWVQNRQDDLRSWIAWHPMLGRVNCYEMLLLMAAHPLRHAEQIEEIKAACMA